MSKQEAETSIIAFELVLKNEDLQERWIRRIVAYIIDFITVLIPITVIFIVISLLLQMFTLLTGMKVLKFPFFDIFLYPFIVGTTQMFYSAYFENLKGKTFGKHLMNLKTKTLNQEKPKIDVALLRNLTKIHPLIVILDMLAGLATKGNPNQKLTDRIAKTTVT